MAKEGTWLPCIKAMRGPFQDEIPTLGNSWYLGRLQVAEQHGFGQANEETYLKREGLGSAHSKNPVPTLKLRDNLGQKSPKEDIYS